MKANRLIIPILLSILISCVERGEDEKVCSYRLERSGQKDVIGYFTKCDIPSSFDSVRILDSTNNTFRLEEPFNLPWDYIVTDRYFIYVGNNGAKFLDRRSEELEFSLKIKGIFGKLYRVDQWAFCESSRGLTIINIDSKEYVEDIVLQSPFICSSVEYSILDSIVRVRNNTDSIWNEIVLP
jgi:hypothetical protein